jgi:uncharacterized repeat protein (TIGR01451 family)
LAGTTIGNQAAATYTDASAIQRTATSNTVITIVQQVAAFTLTSNQTLTSAPGAPVNFPHTITNTGNGTDSFTLSAAATGGTIALVNPLYYIDANCNGVADNAVAITSVTGVAPGGTACFIAVATTPLGAVSGQSGTLTIVAHSNFTPASTNTNTDTVNVTNQAVVNVTKAISVASGPTGTNVTYTLTYTNTGNSAATNVTLADFLPAGMTYVGNAKLNGTTVTDVADADPYDFGITVGGRVTAVVPSVAAGQSGQLTFDATVAAATPPSVLNNQARYCYNDGAGTAGTLNVPVATCMSVNTATSPTAGSGSPTNTAAFTVLQTAAVAVNELSGTTGAAITLAGTTDTVTVASAAQGGIVLFNDYIHNNGNGTDTFNLSLTTGNFPAGTTFLLFKSDGVTPVTDTNAIPDGVVDAGPVAPGAAYLVVVKAILPSGLPAAVGPYANVLTAKSTFDLTKSDTVNNSLTLILSNSVDLTNGARALPAGAGQATVAQGLGVGPSTPTGTINSATGAVNPGSNAIYPLFVTNTSSIADTYSVSLTPATVLPAGWSVHYYADASATQGACTTLGGTVTNTGVINAGANKVVCAVVSTTPSASPGVTNLTFAATSPTTNATDTKAEIVTVNTVRSVTLTPPNAGQVFPSGSVVYSHTLTNNGNVTEGAGGAGSVITFTDPLTGMSTGWNNVVYWDSNRNGTLDPADLVVSGVALNAVTGFTGLLPGASERFFVKVLAPASAAAGDINMSTLTATVTGVLNTVAAPASVVAADTTTVIVGQVILAKTQALDALCDGVADTAFSNGQITTGAIPGACVMYRITATNVGTASVTGVVVSDATPANTTYIAIGASVAATTVGTIGSPIALPASGSAGTVSANVGVLTPGQAALVSFGVKINP